MLRSPSATVRVTLVGSLTPQPFTVLGWSVPDIRAALERLAVAGVHGLRYDGLDQDDLGVWRTPAGDLVGWFADPDGNVLSLTQPRLQPAPKTPAHARR